MSRPEHSRGWRKHLKAQRTENNRLVKESFTTEQKQREMTAASWSAVKGLLNLSTFNNPDLRSLYENSDYLDVLRQRYDACYRDAVTGTESTENRDSFEERYTMDKKSEVYNPLLIRRLSPLLDVVDRALFKPTSNFK